MTYIKIIVWDNGEVRNANYGTPILYIITDLKRKLKDFEVEELVAELKETFPDAKKSDIKTTNLPNRCAFEGRSALAWEPKSGLLRGEYYDWEELIDGIGFANCLSCKKNPLSVFFCNIKEILGAST